MADFAKDSEWMADNFENEDGQYELARFRLALQTELRKTRDKNYAEFIETVSGYIEDDNFWAAISYLSQLRLPK